MSASDVMDAEPRPENGDVLLLIDLSSIYCVNWYATESMETAKNNTIAQVLKLMSAAGSSHVAICCDAPDGNDYRKGIFPAYKSSREAKHPGMIEGMRRTKERLEADGYLLWTASKYEADDILATATKTANERGIEVVIATADKDLMQLVSETVSLLRTTTSESYDPPAVFAEYGVAPCKMRDYLALVGDTSDDVPGVAKIGQKTAALLLNGYGTIEQIWDAAKNGPFELPEFPKAARASLLAHFADLNLSRELVTLRDDAPINFDDVYVKREIKPLPVREYEGMDVIDVEPVEEIPAAPQPAAAAPAPEPPKQPQDGTPSAEKPAKAETMSLVRVPYEKELQPRSSGQAWTLAKGLWQSRLYQKFGSAEAIWAIIIRGREMGIDALTALDCFHIIEGKPVASAMLLHAKAKQHEKCEYFMLVESTDERATYETKHRDNPKPTTLTYTIEEARAAGLLQPSRSGKPNNWLKNAKDMLRKTCAVKLSRSEYPDAALGLYAPEEMGD